MANDPPPPVRALIDGGLWLTIAGAAAVFATQLIGTPTGMIAVVQALTPWAVPPLLVDVVIAWRLGRSSIGLTASGLGGAYLLLMMPLAFPASGPAPDLSATSVRLMTTNILYSNDDFAGIDDAISRSGPDVIAFSEVTERGATGLLAMPSAGRYPYRVAAPDGGASGMMLWSRFPLDDSGSVPAASRSIDAAIDTPSGRVRVVALHPPPPVFDHAAWRRDVEALDEIVAMSDLPTAIIGDLNASYFHPIFRRALRDAHLVDATRAAGDGDRFTWPTDELLPPFVALDHVLLDRGLSVLDTETVRVPGSDHAAVIATVTFSRP